jgi:membrane protein DedA with SNARE-associated domain
VSIIDTIYSTVLSALDSVLAGGMDVFISVMETYGFWAFVAASAIKGAGLFYLGPAEAVTPMYVLYEADTAFQVGIIAVVAAASITFTNFLLYLLGRFAGDRFIDDEDSIGYRIIHWLLNRHGKISLVVLRLVPIINVFIAIPAGLTKIRVRTFMLYSFIGFLIFEGALAFGTYYGVEQGMWGTIPIVGNMTAPG